MTPNAEFGGQLAEAWAAKVKVAGGPHVTYILEGPHAKFKHRDYFRGFDYLMTGECEETFVQFCDHFSKGMLSFPIPGLGRFREDGTVAWTPSEALPDVSKMPLPAYDLWEGNYSKVPLAVQSISGKSVDAAERTTGSLFAGVEKPPPPRLLSQENQG